MKTMIGLMVGAMLVAPVQAATLWNVITTDSTKASLKGTVITDACGIERHLSYGGTIYRVACDKAMGTVVVETDFEGPNKTANRVTLKGASGFDIVKASLVAKYGEPRRENVAVHEDALGFGKRLVVAAHVDDHERLTWIGDTTITLDRVAESSNWTLTYEAAAPLAQAAL